MRRLVLACLAVLVSAVVASAQPVIAPGSFVVGAGGSTTITVQGTPGDNYVLVSSSTNAGFSYAGVDFAVGLDAVLVSIGVIPGGGSVVVPFAPPFPQRDRVYLQAVTSPSPAFVPPTGSNSVVLVNNQEARLYMPIGAIITSAGTVSFGTPGITVSKVGNTYTINHTGLIDIPSAIPSITPTGGATVTSMSANGNTTVVTPSAAADFWFVTQPVRR